MLYSGLSRNMNDTHTLSFSKKHVVWVLDSIFIDGILIKSSFLIFIGSNSD